MKVNEAEREKSKGEQEHKRRAQRYAELEGRIQFLEQKYGRSIKKAKYVNCIFVSFHKELTCEKIKG